MAVLSPRGTSMDNIYHPPFAVNSPTDRRGVLDWVTIALLLLSSVVYVTRCGIKTRKRQLVKGMYEEILLLITWISAVAQAALLLEANTKGFGTRHLAHPNSALKLYLGSQILGVVSLACSKLAITIFILWSMKPRGVLYTFSWITFGSAIVYGIVGIFGLAFQCDAPNTWLVTPGHCPSQSAVVTVVSALNIFSDILLIILPFPIVFKVQFSASAATQSRIIILGVFMARLLVIALTVGYVVAFNDDATTQDPTWSHVTPELWSQGMVFCSLIVSSLPAMFSFLKFMASGAMGVRIYETPRRVSGTPLKGYSGTDARSARVIDNSAHQTTLGHTTQCRSGSHTVHGDDEDLTDTNGIKVMTEVQVDTLSVPSSQEGQSTHDPEKMFS